MRRESACSPSWVLLRRTRRRSSCCTTSWRARRRDGSAATNSSRRSSRIRCTRHVKRKRRQAEMPAITPRWRRVKPLTADGRALSHRSTSPNTNPVLSAYRSVPASNLPFSTQSSLPLLAVSSSKTPKTADTVPCRFLVSPSSIVPLSQSPLRCSTLDPLANMMLFTHGLPTDVAWLYHSAFVHTCAS